MNIETAISNFKTAYGNIAGNDATQANWLVNKLIDSNSGNWEMIIRDLESEIRMGINSLNATRRAEAEAMQAFVNEIRESLAETTTTVETVSEEIAIEEKPRRTYQEYLDFMSRQGQPSDYNSEAEYELGRNYTAFERILAKAKFVPNTLSPEQQAEVDAKKAFKAEALEIIASVTELSDEDWKAAEAWGGKVTVVEPRILMAMLGGATEGGSPVYNGATAGYLANEIFGEVVVERHASGLNRLTKRGVQFAKHFAGFEGF